MVHLKRQYFESEQLWIYTLIKFSIFLICCTYLYEKPVCKIFCSNIESFWRYWILKFLAKLKNENLWNFEYKLFKSASSSQICFHMFRKYASYKRRKWKKIFGNWLLTGDIWPWNCDIWNFWAFSGEYISIQHLVPTSIFLPDSCMAHGLTKNV